MEPQSQHRSAESTGFLVAVAVVALYGIAEAGIHAGLLHPDCHKEGIPWGMVLLVFALVLPKTLGRATAGDIWRIGLKALWRPRGSSSFTAPGDGPVTAESEVQSTGPSPSKPGA